MLHAPYLVVVHPLSVFFFQRLNRKTTVLLRIFGRLPCAVSTGWPGLFISYFLALLASTEARSGLFLILILCFCFLLLISSLHGMGPCSVFTTTFSRFLRVPSFLPLRSPCIFMRITFLFSVLPNLPRKLYVQSYYGVRDPEIKKTGTTPTPVKKQRK